MNDARQSFWDELNDKIKQRPNTPLRETTRADTDNDSWRPQRHLGDSVSYSFNLPLRRNEIMVYMIARRNRDREAIFNHLKTYRDQIDAELEESLEWRPPDGTYKLVLRRNADIENERDKWNQYHEWLIDHVEKLYFAIGPRLTGFDAH